MKEASVIKQVYLVSKVYVVEDAPVIKEVFVLQKVYGIDEACVIEKVFVEKGIILKVFHKRGICH